MHWISPLKRAIIAAQTSAGANGACDIDWYCTFLVAGLRKSGRQLANKQFVSDVRFGSFAADVLCLSSDFCPLLLQEPTNKPRMRKAGEPQEAACHKRTYANRDQELRTSISRSQGAIITKLVTKPKRDCLCRKPQVVSHGRNAGAEYCSAHGRGRTIVGIADRSKRGITIFRSCDPIGT